MRKAKRGRQLGSLGLQTTDHMVAMKNYTNEAREHVEAARRAQEGGRCIAALAQMGLANLKLGMADAHKQSVANPSRREVENLTSVDADAVSLQHEMYDQCLIPAKRKH